MYGVNKLINKLRGDRMGKSHYKKSNGKNVFTDFKHHAKSWANSKRMRSRRTRQQFKSELRSDH